MSHKLHKPTDYDDITDWLEDFVMTRWPEEERYAGTHDEGEALAEKLRTQVERESLEATERLEAWEKHWETCPYMAVLSDLPEM